MTKKETLQKELDKVTKKISKLYLLQKSIQTKLDNHLSKTTYFTCGTGSDTALLPDVYHNKAIGCGRRTSLAKLYLYDRHEYHQQLYPGLGDFIHKEYFIVCPKCSCINRLFDRYEEEIENWILEYKLLFKQVKRINKKWKEITEKDLIGEDK